MSTNKLRALLWAAVSSKPQAEKDSNEQQLSDARALCEQRGWVAVGVLEVPGQSREYIFFPDAAQEIDAYRQLYALCQERAFDILICRGRDRLGRKDALIAQVEAIVRDAGASVYSMTMPVEPEPEPTGRDTWMSALERAKAQDELRELRRRWQAGMISKARRGFWVGSRVPYGYRKVRLLQEQDVPDCESPEGKELDDLVIHWPEARVVQDIFARALRGESLRAIAVYLRHVRPTGSGWGYTTVRRVLRNITYTGMVRFGQYERNRGRTVERKAPPRLLIPGRHSPIVERGTFEQVQALLDKKRDISGRAAGSPHLFSGLVRCGLCGSNYTATRTTRNIIYRCHSHQTYADCDNVGIYENRLKEIILAHITPLARSRETYDAWLATIQAAPQDDHLEDITRGLYANEKATTFWDRQAEAGNVSEAEWLANRRRLQEEREVLETELARLSDVERRALTIPSHEEFASIDLDSAHTLRPLLLRIIDRIIITHERVDVYFAI